LSSSYDFEKTVGAVKGLWGQLEEWVRAGERVALATLVAVRGSAPRQPGARLAVTGTGKMAGSVSGGCVESDVVARAMQVLDSGEPTVATYGISDELGYRVGLSCGGSIDVLIEPYRVGPEWEAVRRALEAQEPAVLAVGVDPTALRGRRLVVTNAGREGSVASRWDAWIEEEARRMLREGGAGVRTVPGEAERGAVFFEAFLPPLRLWIVGATHTAAALGRLAKSVGFRVIVVDPRAAYASAERFPEADELVCASPEQVFGPGVLDEYSYVVVLTHDAKFDVPALALALRSRARYIGLMGARATHQRRRAQLLEQGFAASELDRIRAPIGLDLGGRTPEEIAVAILAEILAVRYGRTARPLRERKTSIHAAE